MDEQVYDHLVISVPGGPLAALYGTPSATPDVFLNEIANAMEESGASTLEIICVDPNTSASYTPQLDSHEAGFNYPKYNGQGWNAVVWNKNPHGVGNHASFHQYCGSDSTVLNGGIWREYTDRANEAIRVLEQRLGLQFNHRVYTKNKKTGRVPEDLQEKVRVDPANCKSESVSYVSTV